MVDFAYVKLLIIYEYAEAYHEWQVPGLERAIRRFHPSVRTAYFHGLVNEYHQGGFRPSRLLNLLYMCAALPFKILLFRPDRVLVKTTPPCIQCVAGLLGWLLRIPVICWLSDYHPEIEIRHLRGRRGWKWIPALLDRLDRFIMRRFERVIALDESMADASRAKAPDVPVIIHPPWFERDPAPPSAAPAVRRSASLNLIYTGNLGWCHDLADLRALLARLGGRVSVELLVVGCSEAGQVRFRELEAVRGVHCATLPRQPADELRRLLEEKEIDYGLILLDPFFAGLLTPGKFNGYLHFGLPLLYAGPPRTVAHEICVKFGAGRWISPSPSPAGLDALAQALLNPAARQEDRRCVSAAAAHYGRFNGESLAKMLLG